MQSKLFSVALVLFVLASVEFASSQPITKPTRIGALMSGSAATAGHYVDAFRSGLRDLGQTEGQTIIVDYRWAEGRSDRFAEFAVELVRSKVDLLLVWGSTAVHAAKQATSTIPIVFVAVGDPIGSGFVASLAHPGGNVTGLSTLGTELAGKRVEILKEVVPKVSRVAVLRNPSNPSSALQLNETQVAAQLLKIQLQSVDVREPSDLDGAFSAVRRDRAGAFIPLGDPVFLSYRTKIAELAAKHRLPAIYWDSQFVEAQGLMSYGVSIADLFRRAATYVDKILKGRAPADLPVEQPMKFEFVVSLKAAKQIGLSVPPNVLVRADKVIK